MEPVDLVLQSISNNVRQVEVISHNIVNANTPGYQAKQVFSQFAVNGQNVLVESAIAKGGGGIISTGRELDVALLNEGYLLVEFQGQQGLTRNGRMFVEDGGNLKHSSGASVIGGSGLINLPDGAVEIKGNGEIFVNGELVDVLVTISPGENAVIEDKGAGIYLSNQPFEIIENSLKQYSVNGASTSTTHDMVRLIELSRHTESLQKAVHAIDQIANAGINELGKN